MIIQPDFSEAPVPVEGGPPKAMLTVRQIDGLTEVRINSSSLGIILSCPRKAYYSLKRNLRAKQESPALTFGKAIHKALEIFYSGSVSERFIPENFRDRSDLLAAGTYDVLFDELLFRAVRGFIETAAPLKGLPDSDKRSIPNGVWILQEYFKTYINDPYTVAVDGHGPITERTCEAKLFEQDGLRIILFGTIDVILKNEANGTVIPADHKTASQLGSDFYNRIKPNHQYSAYLWLAQQCLGITTDTFLVNALQVKAKPVTARGQAPNFARQVTTRSPEDIREFHDAVCFAVGSYLRCEKAEMWPQGHVDNCGMYGGCAFLNVCSAPSNLRENVLEERFA